MGDLFLLKSMIISLVLPMFSSRELESHHSTRLLTSSKYEDSSLSEISPSSVESSENLNSLTEEEEERQSLVYSVKRMGDNTQPWGAPVFRVIELDESPFILTD